MYDRILVAVDGSDHGKAAASQAISLAEQCDATLHALFVIETRTAYDNAIINPEERREALREEGESALDDVRALAEEAGVELVTSIEEGIPSEKILTYLDDHGIEMVCLGERGQSDFKTVLLGSTTETVIHETEIPVVVI